MADVSFLRSTCGFLKLEETDSCDQYESYLSWSITEVANNVLEEYESEIKSFKEGIPGLICCITAFQ